MSAKQPQILLIFESNRNDEIINKLNEKHTVFTTTLLDSDFHQIIAQNHIHVYITIGSKWEKFNHLFTKYGNKLLTRWIHKTEENAINSDLSQVAINVYFSSNIMNTKNETISYYITAYNSGELIFRPYNSLLTQSYKNWELVIIDDSEDDNKVTENIVKRITNEDLRVKYFRSKHSGFIGEVKNYAARLCTGYVICELDHDDEVLPDLTWKLNEVYSNNSDVIFVSSNCCELYDDNQENHLYGESFSYGYGSYSYEWIREKWRSCTQSGLMNITTIRDIVGVPNHIRTWRANALFDMGYNNLEMYVADDYEVILRTVIYCGNNNKRMLHLPMLGYFQYRNRKIGNHTFKRLEQIRSLQSLSHKYYDESLSKIIPLLQERLYPGKERQKVWDNYEGNKCNIISNMPWNWHPQNFNQIAYSDDNFKVSIIISTYKRSSLLSRALESCMNQTYQNFEIIIVGDNCPELSNFMNYRYNGNKSKIRWWNLYTNSNDGGTTPKNYALRNCLRTNLVCYLDDDNMYTPTHLESLVNKFKCNNKLSFAFSSMEMDNYRIICKEPKIMRLDTSTFMHRRELLDKYGYWRKHSDAGYSHDYEIVSRWVKGGELWEATKQVTMIYNMETQSLNNPKYIYSIYSDQINSNEQIDIFTLFTDDSKTSYLRKTASKFNLNVNFIQKEIWEQNSDKIKYMKELINDLPDNRIVCFIDAYDVLANSNDREIVNRFLEYDCDIVFSSELDCYPGEYKEEMIRLNKGFLNSGGYVGYKKQILEMLNWKLPSEVKVSKSDQAYFIEYYLEFNKIKNIKLDRDSNIFQCMHTINPAKIKKRDDKLTLNDRNSCFIHFNGMSHISLVEGGKNYMEELV